MYSKKEETLLKEQFWMALGTYMKPIPSAEDEKINWINYKTGQKNIRFIMQADTSIAAIAIEVSHDEINLQQRTFEKFVQLKKIFINIVKGNWQWEPQQLLANGKTVSRIILKTDNVNILNQHDWPQLISFFKKNIMALDAFWTENKFAFEM
jgi:hypothetical protein